MCPLSRGPDIPNIYRIQPYKPNSGPQLGGGSLFAFATLHTCWWGSLGFRKAPEATLEVFMGTFHLYDGFLGVIWPYRLWDVK